MRDYRNVARSSSAAVDRLEALLGHEECGVRSAAAFALGDLEVRSRPRSALEALAEQGGDDDGLFCDSKRAARTALSALEK